MRIAVILTTVMILQGCQVSTGLARLGGFVVTSYCERIEEDARSVVRDRINRRAYPHEALFDCAE